MATRTLRRTIRLPTLAKIGAMLLVVLLCYHFFDQLAHVFLIGYGAAIVAVAINLIVRRLPLERRWVVAGVGFLFISAVVAALWFGGPLLLEQMRSVAQRAPEFEQQLQALTGRIRAETGLNVAPLNLRVTQALRRVFGSEDVIDQARGAALMVLLPLLVLFGGLFAAANPNDRLLVPVLRMVPRQQRTAVRRAFELLGERLSAWLQGQLIAMISVGTLVTIVLLIIGVPYALLLGVLNTFTEFIPLAGPWMGAIPAVAIAALDDPHKALWTAFGMFAVQMTENNLITPFTMSKVAKVHPFITLFALFLFGSLFGFLGMLLALPLVMLFWTLIQVFWVEGAIDTDRDRIAPVVEE